MDALWRGRYARSLAGEVLRLEEERLERVDGSVQWWKWELRPWFNPSANIGGLVAYVDDLTAQKAAEHLLRNTNQTLQAIRDCHEVMLRVNTEQELLEEICRIIVHSGGERMAWVGFAQSDARKSVRPVAEAGISSEHLRQARVSWADEPRGRGPVGTAIRTAKPCLCHNTLTDPYFAPWRESALKHGYGSVIALPLLADKHCFGALAIYAQQPDAFDAGEQRLLTDLANDLAFGISNLRLRADRERLEEEILKSIEHEQERIGRDLHDGLCQLLVGAKFRGVYLQKISPPGSPAAREAGLLEETLDQAIEQARNLARGLNPLSVTPASLAASLQKLADDVDGAHRVRCACHVSAGLNFTDHHVTHHLFRIAQEAVQNALKHAKADNISITLAQSDGRVVLTVQDDGVGLPRGRQKNGMGLNNMRTRAKLIGGRLEIRRRPRGGTVVVCELFPPSSFPHDTLRQESINAPPTPDFSGG